MNNKVKTAYISFIFISCFLILFITMYTFRSMEIYELSSKEYVMDDILISLKNYNPFSIALSGNTINTSIEDTSFNKAENKKNKHQHIQQKYDFIIDYTNINLNRYTSEDDFYNYLINMLTNGDLSYRILNVTDDSHIIYGLYSDNTLLFRLSLTGNNPKSRLGLNIYDWTPSMNEGKCLLTAEKIVGPYTAYISAPEDFDIYINGILVNANNCSLVNSVLPNELIKTSTYIAIPTINTYEISDLYKEPSVEIMHLGKKVECFSISDNNIYNTYISSSYETYTVKDNEKEIISDAITEYEKNNYENSHIELYFNDNSFTNYTVYSNMSFSCKVTYKMETHFKGEIATQNIVKTYYFALDIIDDKYRVVDTN